MEAAHSIILAERIPWTEEPGDIQTIGSQRVRHDWAHMQTCSTYNLAECTLEEFDLEDCV